MADNVISIPMTIIARGKWEAKSIITTWSPVTYQIPNDLCQAGLELVSCLLGRGRRLENDSGTALRSVRQYDGNLYLDFQQSDYFSSFTHQLQRYVDDPTLGLLARKMEEKYLQASQELSSSPFPNRLGVTVTLITSDNQTLVVNRSAATAVSSSTVTAAISGGIRPSRGDCDGCDPIPVATIIRQATEELGLELDLAGRDQLTFTCLGRDDTIFGQPMLVGVLRVNRPLSDLINLAKSAEDSWEADSLFGVPCDPGVIANLVRDNQMVPVSQLAFVELINFLSS